MSRNRKSSLIERHQVKHGYKRKVILDNLILYLTINHFSDIHVMWLSINALPVFIGFASSMLALAAGAPTEPAFSKCYCVNSSRYSGNYCVNSETAAAAAYYWQHYVETGWATQGSSGTQSGCSYLQVSNIGYFQTSCKQRGAVTADCF